MRENDWTRILSWPGYKVYQVEIDEPPKRLKLWVRRKRGNKQPICSGCGQLVSAIAETYEREVRDLPCFAYLTTVVVELYRLRCPRCGVKAEKVPQLPSKAPFSKRFEDAVGEACESAAARRVARQFGLSTNTVLAIDLRTATIQLPNAVSTYGVHITPRILGKNPSSGIYDFQLAEIGVQGPLGTPYSIPLDSATASNVLSGSPASNVIETCRKLNIPTRKYLADVLPGLAERSIQALAVLTPTAYAANRAK